MPFELRPLLLLGAAAGAGSGIAVGAWSLLSGASLTGALALAVVCLGVGVLLAAVAALGVRLQRKDLP